MKTKGKSRLGAVLAAVLAAVLVILALVWFFFSLRGLQVQQREEGRKQLETALRRAAVACYATEGIYPPDLDYLTAHYGIQIEEEHYIVHYNIFADNLMPDITVLTKDGS